MAAGTISVEQLSGRVGQEFGVSPWLEVSQALIDLFAEATMDQQFIHVDPERASQTALGGTIAHGFLILALLTRMSYEAVPEIDNAAMAVNYGMNRMRFISPVKAGERVRGRFVLSDATMRAADQVLTTWGVSVEIDGRDDPALVAEWLTLTILRSPTG